MIEYKVQIGKAEYRDVAAAMERTGRKLDDFPVWTAQPVAAELKKTMQLVARKMADMHSAGYTPGGHSPFLMQRSGASLRDMKASIRSTHNGNLESVQGQMSSGFWSIHETGGTIRAKSAGYLTIPLPAALDSRGLPLRQRARDWSDTFVAKSRRGNLIIFQKKRGRREITPLYVLKSEVYISPRLKMGHTIETEGLPYFQRKSLEAIERTIDKEMFA